MATPLRMLILDRPTDTDLLLHTLRQENFAPTWQRVQTEADYLAHLHDNLEVILAEYALPQFNALRALELLHERGLDIPLIIVTGAIREEQVVACLKQGAADYVLKSRLGRLGPAVTHALHETELRRAQPRAGDDPLSSGEALRASEERFRLLITQHVDGVVVVDQDGIIQFVNPAAEVLFTRRAEELVGQPFGFPMLVGETTELDIVRQDGTPTVAEMRVVETEWEGDQASLASLRDISDRKRAAVRLRQQAEQLQQAQKMEAVGQLAGGMAHEFNNLLTAILGYSNLLQKSIDRDDVRYGYATQISDVSRRAASLIQQLLAFTRQQVLKPQLLDCNHVVRETEDLMWPVLGERIGLIHHLDPDLGLVEADPMQLQQVLVNLLVNARDAMPEGGELRLETDNVELQAGHETRHLNSPPGAYVRLTVSDTGMGMEPEVMSRLFEPFFTTKEIGKGTGLGLAVVYGIVQQNRGDIEVQSTPEAGTTFTIYLPRVAHIQAPVAMIETVEESPSGSETVLLVEDEHTVRASIRSGLETKGYRVLEAANAQEAIRLCEQHDESIHLLLTDVVMPGMNGHELSQYLASLYPAIRTLLISGGDTTIGAPAAARNGQVAFLPKPFTIDELATRARIVLDLPDANFRKQNPD